MHRSEYLFQKVKGIVFTFIEFSQFYTIMDLKINVIPLVSLEVLCRLIVSVKGEEV